MLSDVISEALEAAKPYLEDDFPVRYLEDETNVTALSHMRALLGYHDIPPPANPKVVFDAERKLYGVELDDLRTGGDPHVVAAVHADPQDLSPLPVVGDVRPGRVGFVRRNHIGQSDGIGHLFGGLARREHSDEAGERGEGRASSVLHGPTSLRQVRRRNAPYGCLLECIRDLNHASLPHTLSAARGKSGD